MNEAAIKNLSNAELVRAGEMSQDPLCVELARRLLPAVEAEEHLEAAKDDARDDYEELRRAVDKVIDILEAAS